MDVPNQQMPQDQGVQAPVSAAPIGGEEKKSSLKVILPIVGVVIVIGIIIWLAV
ncbi:MAG: hypothetical protein Q8P78_00970 [bacterium]|nr:hypothetical protein [bacterium]